MPMMMSHILRPVDFTKSQKPEWRFKKGVKEWEREGGGGGAALKRGGWKMGKGLGGALE